MLRYGQSRTAGVGTAGYYWVLTGYYRAPTGATQGRAAAVLPCGPPRTAGPGTTIGYSRGTRGGTMGHARGTVGSSRGTIGAHKYRAAAQGGARRGTWVGCARPIWLGSRGCCNGCTPLSGGAHIGVPTTCATSCVHGRPHESNEAVLMFGRSRKHICLPTRRQAASPCQRMRLQPSRPPERQRQQRRRSASMVLRRHSTVRVAVHVCAQQ